MRPRTQKQPQVKKELCRALDDVDVDVLMVVELDGIQHFSSLGFPNLLFLGLPFFFVRMVTLSVAVGTYHGLYHEHHVSHRDRHVCEQTLDYFMGGYLALLFATNIMELSIAWMSGKGSIMDTEPRDLIPHLLYIRLALNIIEVLWLSIGVKWIFIDANTCKLTSELYIARAIVVFNWLFLFTILVIVYCAFDSAGRTWVRFKDARLMGDCIDASEGYSRHITHNYQKQWEGCFKKCCCCSGVGQGDENVFTTIGR